MAYALVRERQRHRETERERDLDRGRQAQREDIVKTEGEHIYKPRSWEGGAEQILPHNP